MAQSVRVGSPAARQPEGPAGLRHALRSDVQNNWIYERPGRRGPGAAAGRRVRPAGRRRGHESDRDLGPPPPAGPVRPATVARATRAPAARQVACQYGLQAMLSDSPSRYQSLFDNDSPRRCRGRGRLPAMFPAISDSGDHDDLRTPAGRRLYAWFVTSGRAENSDDAPDFERPCAVYYRLSFAGFMPGAQ